MVRNDTKYEYCVELLKKELIPATGCTEPVAIAYAAAKARDLLGCMPEETLVEVSGNILKNAKSVIVPGTEGLFGIRAAASAGIVAGDAEKKLNVINNLSSEQAADIRRFIKKSDIQVKGLNTPHLFDILVTLGAHGDTVRVRITDTHTNISLMEKNGQVLEEQKLETVSDEAIGSSPICMKDIFDFAETAELDDVKELLDRQISYNWAIAEEGLTNDYGAQVGKILFSESKNLKTRARAYAAAAADARMSGCDMPVVINSGSGNQGISASVPVIVYARVLGLGDEKLYRGLIVSNLTGIYQKKMVGTLSAYCGAVSAGAASAAGIAYMLEGSYDAVIHTLINALAMGSGIICDGAKPSCAAKIALSVEAGLTGYQMYKNGTQFKGGDGILASGAENSLRNVAQLARNGMSETDKVIINIMLES